MRPRSLAAVLPFLMAAAVAIGCASDETGTRTISDSTDDTPDGAVSQPRQRFVEVSGQDLDVGEVGGVSREGGVDGPPLGGVQVCVLKVRSVFQVRGDDSAWEQFQDWEVAFPDEEAPLCQESDADGYLPPLTGLPAQHEIIFEVTKEGYIPGLATLTTGPRDLNLFSSVTLTVGLLVWLAPEGWVPPGLPSDVEFDPALGHVPFRSIASAEPGRTPYLRLSGTTFSRLPDVGSGPLYTRDGVIQGDLQTTDSDGEGWFVNMTTGEYRLTFEHPIADCDLSGSGDGLLYRGFHANDWNQLAFPILEGHVTNQAWTYCACGPVGRGPIDARTCEPMDGGVTD